MEQQAYREQFELEDSHWWFQGRRAVIWSLLERAGVTVAAGSLRVLDAGCGTGRNMLAFEELGTVQGVDFSPEAISFCAARGIGHVVQSRIESMPFDDGSFDLILATDVIEHLQDDRAAVAELRRVAAPGASLLVTVPAYPWLWGPHDAFYHHVRRYTLNSVRETLSKSGFTPVVWSYFNSLLLPPIAAVRLAARLRGHRQAAGRRTDIRLTPPSLDRVLRAPMAVEAALIARGVRLPAGVSIGIVSAAA